MLSNAKKFPSLGIFVSFAAQNAVPNKTIRKKYSTTRQNMLYCGMGNLLD
jgi:hypothetical protein